MTPSGWHNDAHGRDAGHDEMQISVWRAFRESTKTTRTLKNGAYSRTEVGFEFEFVVDNKVIGFADVCEVFEKDEAPIDPVRVVRRRPEFLYMVYEIKPRISSVGGLVRQCTAIRHMVWGFRPYKDSYSSPKCIVTPVVYADDPKIDLLREVYPGEILAWPRMGTTPT